MVSVGLFPLVPNYDAFVSRLKEKFPDVEVVPFNPYGEVEAGALPDVFVIDALSLGGFREHVRSFSAAELGECGPEVKSVLSLGGGDEFWGLPQLLCEFSLFTRDERLRAAAAGGVDALLQASEFGVDFPVYVGEDTLFSLYLGLESLFSPSSSASTWSLSSSSALPDAPVERLRAMVARTPLRLADGGDAAVVRYSECAESRRRHGGEAVPALVAGGGAKAPRFLDAVCVRKSSGTEAPEALRVADFLASAEFLAPLVAETGLQMARAATSDSSAFHVLVAPEGAAAWPAVRAAVLARLLPRVQHPAVAALRALAVDMVCAANSGHPGMPMGMAPAAYALWATMMRADPREAAWTHRDRWILSNGHGSALQYALLHLLGYEGLGMEDLKAFRQIGSRTPGHPEVHVTPGVECNTGPLGQGIATAVGMAIADAHTRAAFAEGLAGDDAAAAPGGARFAVFCGDGCLMEGVALEAVSLAGHLGLGNLLVVYDDNQITIDGSTDMSFSQDVRATFAACGWTVREARRGDWDLREVADAYAAFADDAAAYSAGARGKPTLLCLKTTIGFGSLLQGTSKVHGAPLAADDLRRFKELSALPAAAFEVLETARRDFAALGARLSADAREHRRRTAERFAERQPERHARWLSWQRRELPEGWRALLPTWTPADKALATRAASGKVLNALAPVMGNLLGGSADLTPSNNTWLDCSRDFSREDHGGRYLRFGVREHAMVAAGNGLALYGGLAPFVATFLVFAGYAAGALRAGALGHSPLLVIGTHDSIGLGEDGPTHQPVETLAMLRALPHVLTLRPADANEVSGCYAIFLEQWARADPRKRRTCVLALSRQNLPILEGSQADACARGAYRVQRLGDPKRATPDAVLIATGSEVALAAAAAAALHLEDGNLVLDIVSAPCVELLLEQDEEYLRALLPDGAPVVSVEAACQQGWEQLAHAHVAMHSYGASAPLKDVMKHFGFEEENVKAVVKKAIAHYQGRKDGPHSIVDNIQFQKSLN